MMKIRLLPREDIFFTLFKEQIKLIEKAAVMLKELVENYDKIDIKEHMKKMTEVEHMGDDAVHKVAVQINKVFVTPIDREDIHELSTCLDDILDYIHGSASRMDLFNIKETTPEAKKLVDVIISSVGLIRQGIDILPTFKDITCLRKEMKTLEREGDTINRNALGRLFNNSELAVIYVIKWKEIYESLETATDICEDVFDILEAIVLKHA